MNFDFNGFPMGPALRSYLGVEQNPSNAVQRELTPDDVTMFADALLDHATEKPVADGGVLVNLLEELIVMDMPVAALRMYDAHSAIFPAGDFRAQFHLGNAAMLAGSLIQAEQAFIEAQRLVPGEIAPYVNMAQLLIFDGRFTEAVQWIETGLEVDGNHYGLWDMYAWVLKQQEIPDYAKAVERKAKELHSWAGLSLAAELIAPHEPERKLTALEAFYNEGCMTTEFLVEYTAVLGQCGLYDRIAPAIWRAKTERSEQPLSWKLQLHLAQGQIATGHYAEAAATLDGLLEVKELPEDVVAQVLPALRAEIDEGIQQK